MPAAKSRNRLPSMSSTTRPSPRTGTIGYARGRLGDVHVSSNATWARARGPGRGVTMFGTGRPSARPRTLLNGHLGTRRTHRIHAARILEPEQSGPPARGGE